MGDVGNGILKNTPGFQCKGSGASSSSNNQSTQIRQLRSELDGVKQVAATVYEINIANNEAMAQWMTEFVSADAQGLPLPPQPTPIPIPPIFQPSPPDVDLDNVEFTAD